MDDVNHHIDTVGMHADPLRDVADADCRVDGSRSLHIVRGAISYTGDHSNPTFTLLLLCLRLAGKLARGLSQADL